MNAKSDSHSLTHSLTHSVTYIEFWLNPITYTLVSSKVGLSRMKSSTALDKGGGRHGECVHVSTAVGECVHD